MIRILLALAAWMLFFACSPSSKITGTWKTSKPLTKEYNKILVASLNIDVVARARVESDIAVALSKYGVSATKSIDEFPPSMKNDTLDKETIMYNVRNNGVDGILTVALLRRETQSRYVPGAYPYPVYRYPYYGSFGGYYSYWYPYAYDPGYYELSNVYYFETNLYDAQTEDLIWSAQSQTYDPDNLTTFSKEFSKVLTEKMKQDGIIKELSPVSKN